MSNKISPIYIETSKSLRETLKEHFKSINELPIKGGWGYNKNDSIVIDKNDIVVNSELPFNGIGIEHVILEYRLYEELIIFRATNKKFAGIRWKVKKQSLIGGSNRKYDHIVVEASAHKKEEFEHLKLDYENGRNDHNFNMAEHMRKHEALKYFYESEYWFDITSFYGLK